MFVYKTIVISNEYTLEALTSVNDLTLDIKLLNLNAAYLSLKEYDLLPKNSILKKQNKLSFTTKMKGVFVKTNGKKALLLGSVILLSAKISFFPVYYIIFGILMIIFSLVLRFYGKEKEPIPNKGINS